MSIVKFLVEIVILGIILGLTVEIFKPAIPYLPWLWFGVLVYLTWWIINSKYVLHYLSQFKQKLSPRKRMASYIFVMIIGATLFSFYWWGLNSFLAPKIAAYEAEQRKKEQPPQEIVLRPTKDEQPTFKEKVDKIYFQLGEHGITNSYNIDKLGNKKAKPFYLRGHSPVTVYFENGILYANVQIYGGKGKPPIEIIHNEFVVRGSGWDKNFNREAFEVVDDKSRPVFQYIYKKKNHIIVKGIFPFPGGMILAGEGSARMVSDEVLQNDPSILKNFVLNKIFKYPSSKYPGQLDDVFKPQKKD
jgi:hypothetical protein